MPRRNEEGHYGHCDRCDRRGLVAPSGLCAICRGRPVHRPRGPGIKPDGLEAQRAWRIPLYAAAVAKGWEIKYIHQGESSDAQDR